MNRIKKHLFLIHTILSIVYFIFCMGVAVIFALDNEITVIESLTVTTLGVGFFMYVGKIINPLLSKEIKKQHFTTRVAEHMYPCIDQYLHSHEPKTLYVSPAIYKMYFGNVKYCWYHRHQKRLLEFEVHVDPEMEKYEFGPTPKLGIIETIDDFYI